MPGIFTTFYLSQNFIVVHKCYVHGTNRNADVFLGNISSVNEEVHVVAGAYLGNLKKIRRNKRNLRKSMEVMLQQQQMASDGDLVPGPPPDVINSTENFMNFVQYENTASNNFLEEIDSAVNQTLSSIEVEGASPPKRKYPGRVSDSEDTEDDLDAPASRSRHRGNKYRTEAELWLAAQQAQAQAGSMSSLSSHDTYSSEQYGSLTSSQSNQYAPRTFKLTSQQLAGTMATLLPSDGQHDTSGDSSQYAAISPDQLQAIREQMAVSLQRMRELEEQVKNIPILQVGRNHAGACMCECAGV